MFMRNFDLLREYIYRLIEASKEKPDLLVEPDKTKDRDEEEEEVDEFSAAGAVAGAITPMGTDSSYPKKTRSKSKKSRK